MDYRHELVAAPWSLEACFALAITATNDTLDSLDFQPAVCPDEAVFVGQKAEQALKLFCPDYDFVEFDSLALLERLNQL